MFGAILKKNINELSTTLSMSSNAMDVTFQIQTHKFTSLYDNSLQFVTKTQVLSVYMKSAHFWLVFNSMLE